MNPFSSLLFSQYLAPMLYETLIGDDVQMAADWLSKGACVGVPTETVYGLAANALDEAAVLKIFEAKQRPHFDPLIVHVADIKSAERITTNIPEKARNLFSAFSPGPVTILLPKQPIIPDLVTSGLDTVGIRIPAHPLLQELLRSLPFPLAAPSANPFGYISPTTADHVYAQLQGKIPYILDGGACKVGIESTIIGFEGEKPVLYRPGGLSVEQIEACVGPVIFHTESGSHPAAPGMLKTHYAPRKKLRWLTNDAKPSSRTAIIGFDKYLPGIAAENQILLSPAGDLQEAASRLFAVMRELDASAFEEILAVPFPAHGLGLAINDRLRRAASEE